MRARSLVLTLAAAALLPSATPVAAHIIGVNILSHGAVSGPNIGGLTHGPSGRGPGPQLGGNGGAGRGGPPIQRKK
jgi:hypothetical protein